MRTGMIRILATVVILAFVAAPALAAGGFQAVVSSGSMKVYGTDAAHSYLGSLPQGTRVTVENYSGDVALISCNGRKGIARMSDLTAVAASAPAAETFERASDGELSGAKTMVANQATRVYSRPSKSARYVGIQSGAEVQVLSISGSVAKVARDGVVGYMPAGHLSEANAAGEQEAGQKQQADTGMVKYDRVDVATTGSARIYAKPSTSSASVTVAKGTRMVLLAAKGDCAMVEKDGRVGYISRNRLTTDIASVSQPSASTAETAVGKVDSVSFSGSNQDIIFQFLTRVAGYNAAAACGILANIKYESDFKETTRGDSGSSYGIVQWHASRKTRLINWCQENGYDYTSLKGQLYFLQYELKHYYPAVHNRLKAVSNNEQGAYNAGYEFCYNFEAPANRASKSVTRGNYARSTMWTRYAA